MKKNFFKKLALVMALAVTVTSVPSTSASAAAAPGFKSSAVKVNVGQTKKYSTANTTKYSVSFKIGNKSVATIAKSGKAVKVTGVAAGKTTLKATFKNYKTKKVTTAKVPVTVVEEATTVKSVEAKGVKTLVVTFNKAVDTTKAVVAVTKGTAKPSITSTTWADDKKSATIVMASKLTEGTYTVSVTGLTETALTGNVTVQNEKLTSIEVIGTNLVESEVTTASKASIDFKALNQYGEKMSGTDVQATSSFGYANVAQSSASKVGTVTVDVTNSALRVYGTTGSLVLVEKNTGISATATVTYSAPASPKALTVGGIYSVADSKFEDMTKGDTVTDYVLLVKVADQYGNNLTASKLNANNMKATPVNGGGVTGVAAVSSWTDKTVDKVDYISIPLTGSTAEAGSFYITFVNPKLGLLANSTFTVKSGTIIKSFSAYATDTVYGNGVENVLTFEAVDADGNAVTKYSVLEPLFKFDTTDGTVKFVKKADGSAKLVFTVSTALGSKASKSVSFSATVNKDIYTSLMVKTFMFTASEKAITQSVVGLKNGTATAMAAKTNESITIKLADIVVEDQYSNTMSNPTFTDITATVSGAGFTLTSSSTDKTITIKTDDNTPRKGTLSLTGKDGVAKEITISALDTSNATGLTIKSVKSGNTLNATSSATLTESDVKVTGNVAGEIVTLPVSQYRVTGNTATILGNRTTPGVAVQTLTGNVEVTVDTVKGSVVVAKDFTYSNAAPVLTTLTEKAGATPIAGNVALNSANLSTLFDAKDQYGDPAVIIGNISAKFDVVYVSGVTTAPTITNNNTNGVNVTASANTKYNVTLTCGAISQTVEFTTGA